MKITIEVAAVARWVNHTQSLGALMLALAVEKNAGPSRQEAASALEEVIANGPSNEALCLASIVADCLEES